MNTIIERIKKGHFWKFHGGIHPPEQKFLTTDKPIKTLALPKQLVVPIQQHIGQAGDLLVTVGQHVLKGQALTHASSPMAVPVHAPTSGVIDKIENHVIAHPSGLSDLCILITPDGKDTWCERYINEDFTTLDKQSLIEKIANAGIAGMGGAGFPTHIKIDTQPNVEYLIINAAECEPYITADDLLIREHASTIANGIKILQQILQAKHILIGIEDNKPEAIATLKKVTNDIENCLVCVVPTKYPTGGEKQLIKVLTGKEVPSKTLPIKLGIVMQNIATCFAIAEAVIEDIPLIRRVVTVSGKALEKPQNVWALLGTPIHHALAQCGYKTPDDTKKHLIMGGPMMGFSLPTDNVPIVKITNCILAPSEQEISSTSKEVECIRCGQCADVCPSQLLPQELQWSAKAKDYPQLNKLNLFDCIDCGACAYVCPSQIPLVQYYRVAKAEIRHLQEQELKAEHAKVRFEARKLRLEREKLEREEKQRLASEARRAAMNKATPEASNAKSAVAAALARVKAKKALESGLESETHASTDNIVTADNDVKNQAAAAIARAKAKKAAKLAKESETTSSPDIIENKENTVETKPTLNNSDGKDEDKDSKKAKIAAAIAKAKAQKQQASLTNNTAEVKETTKTEQAITDKVPAIKPNTDKPKQVALEDEETVANSSSISNDNDDDDKKAKIKAAIAKAKAKKEKLATPPTSDERSELIENTKSDNNKADAEEKKQRIAAAIAKAKAKKQQQSET